MTPALLRRTLLATSALFLGGSVPSTARGQFLDQPPSAFVVSPGASVVTSAPSAATSRALTRQERRAARRQARYETLRPTYASAPGITFAPFSDRYYPRTIFSRDVPARATVPAPVVTTIAPR